MKKKLIVLAAIAVMVVVMCGCSGKSAMIGHWGIKEIDSGEVVMTEKDVKDMGLDSGYLELKRSGNVELVVLGDTYEGTWTADDDKTATVTYSNEDNPDSMTGTVKVVDGGITFKDAQGSTYKMKRF